MITYYVVKSSGAYLIKNVYNSSDEIITITNSAIIANNSLKNLKKKT